MSQDEKRVGGNFTEVEKDMRDRAGEEEEEVQNQISYPSNLHIHQSSYCSLSAILQFVKIFAQTITSTESSTKLVLLT